MLDRIQPGSGRVQVTATGPLGPLLAVLCGLPRGGEAAAALDVAADGDSTIWTRQFGARRRRSRLRRRGETLIERIGPLKLEFTITESPGAVELRSRRIGWFGVPVRAGLLRVGALIERNGCETTSTIAVDAARGRLGSLTYVVEIAS